MSLGNDARLRTPPLRSLNCVLQSRQPEPAVSLRRPVWPLGHRRRAIAHTIHRDQPLFTGNPRNSDPLRLLTLTGAGSDKPGRPTPRPTPSDRLSGVGGYLGSYSRRKEGLYRICGWAYCVLATAGGLVGGEGNARTYGCSNLRVISRTRRHLREVRICDRSSVKGSACAIGNDRPRPDGSKHGAPADAERAPVRGV